MPARYRWRPRRLPCLSLLGGLLAAGRLRAADAPTVVVRDITIPGGQTFQMPLHGVDPQNSPLTFSLVSINNTNVTGALTHGNRSMRLDIAGTDANSSYFTGALIFELFDDITSNTTARISTLVESNFYNGLTFHRIIAGFVAQGGDPNGDGSGGSGVVFKDEFATNLTFCGFGQLAMANSGDDSNDSQFFVTDPNLTWEISPGVTNIPGPAHLTLDYTLFGQLTSGFDVLATLLQTPVEFFNGEDSRPVFPETITAATIFTNRSDAVLRLSAVRGFTGTVVVTVGAMNTNNIATQTSFHATVIKDPLNNRPFLETLPTSLVITQNTLGSVVLKADDLENDPLSPVALPGTGLQAEFNGTLQGYVLVPDTGFTGTVKTVIGVWDGVTRGSGGIDEYDTETIQVTVVPGSAAPTLDLVLKKGVVLNTSTPNFDQVAIQATLKFNTNAVARSFDPQTEPFELIVGGQTGPLVLALGPGDPGWKSKGGKFTWQSAKGSIPNMKLIWDTKGDKLTFSAQKFNFGPQQTNPIQVRLRTGKNWTFDQHNWPAKTTGWFVFP